MGTGRLRITDLRLNGERGPPHRKAYYKPSRHAHAKRSKRTLVRLATILPPKKLRVAHVQEKAAPGSRYAGPTDNVARCILSDVAIIGYRGYLGQPGENGALECDPYHEPLRFLIASSRSVSPFHVWISIERRGSQ